MKKIIMLSMFIILLMPFVNAYYYYAGGGATVARNYHLYDGEILVDDPNHLEYNCEINKFYYSNYTKIALLEKECDDNQKYKIMAINIDFWNDPNVRHIKSYQFITYQEWMNIYYMTTPFYGSEGYNYGKVTYHEKAIGLTHWY